MGAEFFGQLGQSLDRVAADSFRQQQIINDRQEALDALEISNNFEVDLGTKELEARKNYQFDGKYTENANQRFEQLKQQTLSNIKGDRVKARVAQGLEKYKGQFQLSNLAFQNGAQQLKQQEQLDDALSMEMGAISINANRDQVAISQEKLFQLNEGLPPEKRIAADQEIKDRTFQTYFDTKASGSIEAYSQGNLTQKELAASFDGILAELSDSKVDLSSRQRQSLISAYQNKKISALKNLRTVNKQAAINKWSSALSLQSQNRRALTEDDLNNYLRFVENEPDKQVARLQFEISKQKGGILDDIEQGDRGAALSKIDNFETLSEQAIANNDVVKAAQYTAAAESLKQTYQQKFKEIQNSVIDAFPFDAELERKYQDDPKAFVTDSIAKAQGVGIRADSANFLKGTDKQQAINILTSNDFDGIKQYFGNLRNKWDFQHESLPDGHTPFDSIIGDVLADKNIPNNAKGVLMYGMDKDYGNLIMDLARVDVPVSAEKAYGKSKADVSKKTMKLLKPYAKALANSGDFQSSESFLTLNANVITDLVFRSAYSPKVQKALGISDSGTFGTGLGAINDAVEKIAAITIEGSYDISKDAQGNDIMLHKDFANEAYKDALKSPTFYESFVNNSISPMLRIEETTDSGTPTAGTFLENVSSALEQRLTTKADAEYALKFKKDIKSLTPEERKRVVYKDVYADVLIKQILESGSFRPVQNTSRARLYVDYDGQSFPLSINGEYFEFGSSDEELTMARIKAPTYSTKEEKRQVRMNTFTGGAL